MNETTCCFFGHRTIHETEELKISLTQAIEGLIVNEKVDTFLFGSKSRFDDLCLALVSKLKEKYPHVRRIYVRAEFPDIGEEYKTYLLKFYEDTYYPEGMRGAGRAVYVERNREMIDRSRFCVVYYDGAAAPVTRKSGTKLALDYARSREKEVFLFPANTNETNQKNYSIIQEANPSVKPIGLLGSSKR